MPAEKPLILTRQEVRSIDATAISRLGIPGLVLMENAARGICDTIRQHYANCQNIVIACGFGNNGGDGLALARQLATCHTTPRVLLFRCGKDLTSDAAANLRIIESLGMKIHDVTDANIIKNLLLEMTAEDLIVDCLLGTGVTGAVRQPLSQVVDFINKSPAKVLAADVPSGLDCDTGTTSGTCVVADRTVTFVALKRGFGNPKSIDYTGDVSVAHIGLPSQWCRTVADTDE